MNQQWTRRDLLKRTGFAAAAAVGGPALLTSCAKTEEAGGGGGALDRIRNDGRVKVGFANEAPFGFRDKSGNLTGEAPELARAIFKAMGVNQMEPVLAKSFDALIPGLAAQQYDIIAAGMFITPERCQQIAFTNPDYFGSNAFLVKKGNPSGIKTFDEVKSTGIKLGVLGGAVEKGYAQASGVAGNKIITFPDQNAAFQGMLADRVQAVALTSASLRWTLSQNYAGRPLEVTEPFVPVVEGKEQPNFGGFGIRKADTDLLNAFNAELKKLQDANGVLPLIQRFGFTQTDVETAKEQTAANLCKSA
ncbi:MAG TPA: ectoine/hydroxyectoine ABC transporter substrate-binding protein EhuB [Streptosporangiaceae bacterium]|nr:ectoine/hydroxyectoine ABC transporter substrate-binding protein EhuB [Streptosporangiaceae bacterium]